MLEAGSLAVSAGGKTASLKQDNPYHMDHLVWKNKQTKKRPNNMNCMTQVNTNDSPPFC